MKKILFINFCSILAVETSAFYRKNFEQFADDHYEFQGGRPHEKIFKNLILARFDPGLVDDKIRFYLREVVDHLARGPAGHDHGRKRTKLRKFQHINEQYENNRRKNTMNDNQKRARKFFSKHHRRN